MKKKSTIRDVAKKAGVSVSSVHIALSGKEGVSSETREHIKAVADELGYQPNSYASKLKKRTQHVVILLPSELGDNGYYYPEIWHGIKDYKSSTNANVQFTEIPFGPNEEKQAINQLKKLINKGEVDGILTVGNLDSDNITPQDWNVFSNLGVAVVFIISQNHHSSSICCVQPDYKVIGRTMAELICGRVAEYGSILMVAGNPNWPSHSLVVEGFKEFLTENNKTNMVYYNHSWTSSDDNYQAILNELKRPDISACCSVYSIGTVMMCRALEESGKAGHVFAVGSDLSNKAKAAIRNGVLNNSIQKNPYAQGYVGLRTLVDYLENNKTPEEHRIYVGCEVVFKSNLAMYEHHRYSNLFF